MCFQLCYISTVVLYCVWYSILTLKGIRAWSENVEAEVDADRLKGFRIVHPILSAMEIARAQICCCVEGALGCIKGQPSSGRPNG